jgi:hypothetical protein
VNGVVFVKEGKPGARVRPGFLTGALRVFVGCREGWRVSAMNGRSSQRGTKHFSDRFAQVSRHSTQVVMHAGSGPMSRRFTTQPGFLDFAS